MPSLHLLKRASQAALATSAVYVAGIWYATNHPEFEKYVPLSHTVIDVLEEREFNSRAAARARKISDEETQRLNTSFYYRKVNPIQTNSQSSSAATPSGSSDSSKPHTRVSSSQITSAVTPTRNVSALTSRLDEEFSDEDRQKSSSHKNDATMALASNDPLAPTRFFDAVSGTVGQGREYLPLVLLPDESDKDVNKAAMSLNGLIANINNTVVTEDSVLLVTRTLEELARKKAAVRPHYANALLVKSQVFDQLHQAYKVLWNEYIDNQDPTTVSSSKINPVVSEYSRKLSKEVIDTEMLLVKLINSSKDLELTPEEKDKEFQDDYYRNQLSKPLKESKSKKTQASIDPAKSTTNTPISAISKTASTTNTTNSATPVSKPFGIDPTIYGALEPSNTSLQLELALTLLINALRPHSSVPLGPYIQGVRNAVENPSPYSAFSSQIEGLGEKPDRKTLINETLKKISVPQDVDLKPILDDILANYDDEPSSKK